MRLNRDILLDQEEFNKASADLDRLGQDLADLRARIETMLENLLEGFDTPAGRSFIESCRTNLMEPMDKQAAVLKHVSGLLAQSKSRYEPVFAAYAELNNSVQF